MDSFSCCCPYKSDWLFTLHGKEFAQASSPLNNYRFSFPWHLQITWFVLSGKNLQIAWKFKTGDVWIPLPLLPGQPSHFSPGGRQRSHTCSLGGLQTEWVVPGLVAYGFTHWTFSLRGAEEAMVTQVCVSDDLGCQEIVFVTSCSLGKIGWGWSYCSSICRQKSMGSRNSVTLSKVL